MFCGNAAVIRRRSILLFSFDKRYSRKRCGDYQSYASCADRRSASALGDVLARSTFVLNFAFGLGLLVAAFGLGIGLCVCHGQLCRTEITDSVLIRVDVSRYSLGAALVTIRVTSVRIGV